MIQIISISYNISKGISKKFNHELKEIITFFIELGEDSGDFDHMLDYVFPTFMARNEIEKCKKTLYELQEYTTDSFPHNLTPLQEYTLYFLIEWFNDVNVEDNNKATDITSINPITKDDEYILDKIDDLESYPYFLFDDWDFLDVDAFVHLFFNSKNTLEFFNVDLDQYIELMPYDIRERYLQQRNSNPSQESENIEELIVRLIYSAIKQKEMDPRRLMETKETQLSDDIAHVLQTSLSDKGIIVAREQPGGFARKNTGEIDFFIYTQTKHTFKPIAIGENKEWGNYKNQCKQLIGYMNEDIPFGFTILFNKTTNLHTVLRRREEMLKGFFLDIEGKKYFETVELTMGLDEIENVIISTHKNPENQSCFKIYHFIVNAYRPEREEAAKQARG
ncbi:hypothetical protein [Bacillus sp. FJAT-45066]|uniref:hypothetical protein n=1 Tax=Bacillus sp. FJAT-45066 TaxID=2011010 RepID=UPI000BB863B9|nr:hypothetical protein [Bacillus sp. FJAT-45066]